jgi:peroxiredoxin
MSRIAAALLALSLTIAPAAAQDAPGSEVDFGPAIGDSVDFGTLTDQTGAARDQASVTGANGLVLMFVRSADWCPYCQAQMIEINESLAEIEARGYGFATISYDSTEILSRFTGRQSIDYTMLSDADSRVIDQYGLREERYEEGHRAHGVPKPIVFILNEDGVIEGKLFEEDYRVRPPAAAVVEAIDAINGSGA